ncbi:MAG: hemerythrin domain-containing protein [Saccharofermentanales bacterium]|jgi:hemerythrin superfamily protein
METVLTEIKSEHDEARTLMQKIDNSERITWKDVEELYVMLKGHHAAEEEIVFPNVKKVDKSAEELVEHLLKEHGESESGLLTMIRVKKFDQLRFREIKGMLDHHMKQEETVIFQKARKAMTEGELKSALEPFEKVEEKGKKEAESKVK